MKSLNGIFKQTILLTALLAVMFLTGCSKDETVSPVADNMEVSMMSSGGVTDNGLNTLTLDSVKVLLKDIKLNVSAASDDSVNFKTGPFVLRLNMNSSVNVISTAYIPEGTYDKVMFEVHKLQDGELVDTAFSFGGGRYSVVVYGKFNLVPFIYRSSKSAKQKISYSPAVGISNTTKSNITLKVQPYTWFWNGTDYIDPSVLSNENDIDNNIKASFKAFRDNNKDGIPD